jgi:macrolide transport system ATP-binding/permease protein
VITPPLLELRKLRRAYAAGEDTLVVLKDVDLTIHPGEMVAIVGQSGSGKSTLMNILGCLDRPTSGSYNVGGRDTSEMPADELAQLRREHFGFVFQRYHLLSDLTALGNVEVPAIYAGIPQASRRSRALQILARLGLSDRTDHRPAQLSGGQQQRVSVARALMNGGEIVLADEPTGALDSVSGAELMKLLKGLNAQGHTIIIVTHDIGIAEHCGRVIEIKDGVILADRVGQNAGEALDAKLPVAAAQSQNAWRARIDSLKEALGMSLLAMRAHKLRTFLTMLGIIIGIASVVSVVAVGDAARNKVLKDISSIGTNTLEVMPGTGYGDLRAGSIRTLNLADAEALSRQPYIDSVTPSVQTSVTGLYRDKAATVQVSGVGEQYFRVKDLQLAEGRLFDADDVRQNAAVVVIDVNTQKTFFKDRQGSSLGEVIIFGSVPARVIGVLQKKSGFGGGGDNAVVYMPYSAVNARFLGASNLRSITVRIKDDINNDAAEAEVTRLLTARHRVKDFFIINNDQIRQTINSTTATLKLLISAIAVISLVVGGIGVMNIMLVSVTERTGEIGVRIAVGARQSDILQQFLIESILVCLIGGVLGVALAAGFGALFSFIFKDFPISLSMSSVLWAFFTSTLIGIVFGYLPARNAARLDPVAALARD